MAILTAAIVLVLALLGVAAAIAARAQARTRAALFEAELAEPQHVRALAPRTREEEHERLFEEYRAAKVALGENVDAITLECFVERVEHARLTHELQVGRRVERFEVLTAEGLVSIRPVFGEAFEVQAVERGQQTITVVPARRGRTAGRLEV